MTVIAGTTVAWSLSPRIITIPAPITEVTVTDLHETLLDLEDSVEGMIWPTLRNTSGGEALGGGVTVGVTSELQNAQLAFEARTTQLESGTVTTGAAPGALTIELIDTAATFQTNNVSRGDLIYNVTDGSQATVLELDGTTPETKLVATLLEGGTDNDFDLGDSYVIYDVVQCRVTGGNLVAVDDVAAELSPIFPTFGTQVLTTASSSATSQNAASLEYAAFVNAVWVDAVNGTDASTGYAATGRPYGTPQDPVKTVTNAVSIQAERGLPKTIQFLGDYTFASGEDVTGFKLVGSNSVRTLLTLTAAATITDVEITDATVTGTLDGNAIIRDGHVYDITYFSGEIHDCQISGTITLGNSAQANILDCHSRVAGSGTPIFDFGGSGQSLYLSNYNGGALLQNKSGSESSTINLQAGQVKVDLTTVTGGTIVVRGDGKVVDAADETDFLLSGTYGSLTLENETNTARMLQEVWIRLGLDPDNPLTSRSDGSIDATGIDINATPSGADIIQTRQ